MNEDHCVCCGDPIPEGLQVCPVCEKRFNLISSITPNDKIKKEMNE